MIPPEGKAGIFGFAEFVQAFALLALVFTLTGVRYQFRIETAPVRVWTLTYWISGTIGLLALLSDFWFAKRYPLPSFLSDQSYWQGGLGLAFLSMSLVWFWFAYVRPPTFGRANAYVFTRTVFRHVLQGIDSDLPIIADEIERSADRIVKSAVAALEAENNPSITSARPRCEYAALDLMLIFGNRKFCKHVAINAPNTAIALLRAAAKYGRYDLPLAQFSSAVSTAALENRDSLLYQENTGYLGYTRPFTNALFGNFEFVEALAVSGSSPLDIDLDARRSIDGPQLEAYAGALLTTFKASLALHHHLHSYSLTRAFAIVESSVSDLYRLNEPLAAQERGDIHARLQAAMSFVDDAIRAMEAAGIRNTRLRRHDEPHKWHDDNYDRIAQLIVKIIEHASAVTTREFEGWSIQFGAVWSRISNFDNSRTREIVLFKVRRLLYEEVKSVAVRPNFLNARYLGYLLNVLGLTVGKKSDFRRSDYPLRKVVISFAKRNYLSLVERQPIVAEAVLMGTITFDKENRQLVKTYSRGLNLVPPTDTLDLLDPPAV